GVEHAQALRDAVERRIEPEVLALQFPPSLLFARCRRDLRRDVLVRDHPAEPRSIDVSGLDRAAAGEFFTHDRARALAVGEQGGLVGRDETPRALVPVMPKFAGELADGIEAHAFAQPGSRKPVNVAV